MKKVIASVAVALLYATTSFCDINVGWGASLGFFDASSNPLLQSGTVLAQLIFTQSGVIGTANDDAGNDYLGVGNDNQLLQAIVLANGSTAQSEYGDFNGGAAIYSGYNGPAFIYARIFQSATPTAGSWYYNSPLLAVTTYQPGNPLETLQVNRDLANGDGVYASAPNNFQVQAVPEPTTMALLGLGGLLMALRRRKA